MNFLVYEKHRSSEVNKYGVNIAALDFVIEVDGSTFKYIKDRSGVYNTSETYKIEYFNHHMKIIYGYYLKKKLVNDLIDITQSIHVSTEDYLYSKIDKMIDKYEENKKIV